MPIYEYRCEEGHTFEVLQRMTDDPLTVCPEHGKPVQRVFHPVAVHFKGSGFYNTDYGKNKKAAASAEGKADSAASGTSSDSKKSDSGSGSSPKKDSAAKPASKPAGGSSSD
jgi:putative FmdB family regulatory protein